MAEAGLNILAYIQVSLQTPGSFLKASKGYKLAEVGLNILAYIQVSLQTSGSFLRLAKAKNCLRLV